MREGRRRETERLVQQDLARRVGDVVFAPHHVRHFHQRIVDHDREVVGGRAVGPDDDRVADDVGLEPDVAAHGVGEDDVALLGHAKPNRGAFAGRDARRGLFARQPAAGAGVARRPAVRERVLALGVELRGRTEAVVRGSRAEQLRGVRLIEMQPLRLPVRTVRAADVGPFVPVEPEPAQVAHDRGLRLARRSLDVGVLDAQDEGAAGAAREQPVEQRRAGVADVQLPGGAGSEADSHELLALP